MRKTDVAIIILIFFSIAGILFFLFFIGVQRSITHTEKVLMNCLDNSIDHYFLDQLTYPPDDEESSKGECTLIRYRNDILIKYLDGDPTNGGPDIEYFIEPQFINKVWYHNFLDDFPRLTGRLIDKNNPCHPWTNIINFTGFQIYTKYRGGKLYEDAYDGREKTPENFIWYTNYPKYAW